MATPRNKKVAKARALEKLDQRPKGLPRAQFPPGNHYWMNGVLIQEAFLMAMADESITLVQPILKDYTHDTRS